MYINVHSTLYSFNNLQIMDKIMHNVNSWVMYRIGPQHYIWTAWNYFNNYNFTIVSTNHKMSQMFQFQWASSSSHVFFPPFPPCCLPTNYSADLTFSSCLRESRPICPEKGQSLCRVLVIYNSNSVPFLQFPLAQVKQLVEHILALNWSWHNCQSEKK